MMRRTTCNNPVKSEKIEKNMDGRFNSSIEKEFADYLIALGYPRDSIVYEPAIHSPDGRMRYRPDFLIVDPIKKERLALIEIKGSKDFDYAKVYGQLLDYAKAVGDDNVPLYLITPSESQMLPFDMHVFSIEGGLLPMEFSLFPTFPALTAEESAERKASLRIEKKSTVESFQHVSWALATLLIFLVIADFIAEQYSIAVLTTERMALIGAAVALVVIPYAQKFKGLGFEWEKAEKRDDRS